MHMDLLSTIDRGYRLPFRVTLSSLLRRLDPGATVDWHVVESGLEAADRAEIEATAARGPVRMRWYALPPLDGAQFPAHGRFVPHVYARILAPALLPEDVERFLYLDGDLLVLDDVSILWSANTGDAVLAAVQDMAVPRVSSPLGLARYRELGFAADAPYFNAGVYLVDTARWRAGDITPRALDYIARHGASINLLDQDALNAVIGGRWSPLPLRWNLVAGLAGRRHYRPRGIDPGEYESALGNPGIVHFSGLLKPWALRRLASPWSPDYERALIEVQPDHRFDRSPRARALSFYDRRLRRALYPLEHRIWMKRKGF